jgi:hypothetical protein
LDWALVIDRNREALRPIVETLFAMLFLVGAATRISRGVHRQVLRLLRPAESAVRRLIVIVARGLVVKPVPARAMPLGTIIGKAKAPNARPSFQLFDTRKRFAVLQPVTAKRVLPRIRVLIPGYDPRVAAIFAARQRAATPPPPPPPDGLVAVARLVRRLHALKSALEDLPRQAKRLARWRAKRQTISHLKMRYPMRPGRPPGHRAKKTHEIDEILSDCHYFA